VLASRRLKLGGGAGKCSTRKVFDTESVRHGKCSKRKVFDKGNCSTISLFVRLGFVGQLPCGTTSVSDNFRVGQLFTPLLNM